MLGTLLNIYFLLSFESIKNTLKINNEDILTYSLRNAGYRSMTMCRGRGYCWFHMCYIKLVSQQGVYCIVIVAKPYIWILSIQ